MAASALLTFVSFFIRWRGFAGFDELAPGRVPAADAGDGVFPTYPVVAGIAVGLENAFEAIEQPQGHLLTA